VVHTGGDINGGDESLPLATHFRAPYPATKAEAETLVLEASDGELSTCALRPHLIWGPGDPHFLPRLEAKARRGRLALPAPDKRVDTIFVDNAAQAHLMALDELCGEGRCAGKPYFITNNEPLTQGEIISRLLHAIGIEVEIRPVPTVLARAAAAVCETAWGSLRLSSEPPLTRFSLEQLATAHWYDTSAALRDFGYRPAISIADGLERLARWWRDGAR
jgi:nucleoside-diphosphate-sugar epimerase